MTAPTTTLLRDLDRLTADLTRADARGFTARANRMEADIERIEAALAGRAQHGDDTANAWLTGQGF